MENQDTVSPKKGNKRALKVILIVVGIIIVLSLVVSESGRGAGTSTDQTTTAAPDTTLSPIAVGCQSYSTSTQAISYKELEKDPSSFQGQSATFTGQVVQIQESNGEGFIRLAVDKDTFGNWNISDVVLVQYDGHSDALEDDVINVNGVMEGSQTYTSQANFQITVPLMYGCSIQEGAKTSVSPGAKTSTVKTASVPAQAQTPTPPPTPTNSQSTPPASNETVSQENAVRKAQSYLDFSAFSHDGLVAQLEYDQFSQADAMYGAANSGTNWDEQAAAKAKSYMQLSAFSRDGLIAQLEYDKFTQEQAEYGANAVGL
jgi:hypothetical protein